jgi:uncharacterized protein (TIGR02996 family)
MTHEEAFLQAILDSPDDDTPRLVYADWLEEQGDQRARTVRDHPDLFHFLARLKDVADVETSLQQLAGWPFEGKAHLVSALALFLGCRPNPTRLVQRLPGVDERAIARVVQALTLTPAPRNADLDLQDVVGQPPKASEVAERASRLAAGVTPSVLVGVLEQLQQDSQYLELLGCLAQEMVLRGVVLEGVAVAEAVVAGLKERDHPLAWLPLSLTSVEGDLRRWLPRYGGEGIVSWSGAYLSSQVEGDSLQVPSDDNLAVLQEVTDEAMAARIATAVRNWCEESNGQVEARVFQTGQSLGVGALSVGLLQSLRLPCLEVAVGDTLAAGQVTARQVFGLVFAAACTGGAYNRGLNGAYGRLAAWQSVAGLCDASLDADVTTVSELAQRCLWVSYGARSDWFYHVAWDLGVVAVRADGKSLAVLAATDTD